MIKHDISGNVPPTANAVELHVTIDPTYDRIAVYRKLDDSEPLIMGSGATTIIGMPSNRCFYVRSLNPDATYKLEVLRWLE